MGNRLAAVVVALGFAIGCDGGGGDAAVDAMSIDATGNDGSAVDGGPVDSTAADGAAADAATTDAATTDAATTDAATTDAASTDAATTDAATTDAATDATTDATPDATPLFTLTVMMDGTGTGTVTSDPIGITCAGDCSETYSSGTPVMLTANPTGGSTFGGWSVDCSGVGVAMVNMTGNRNCTATFHGPQANFHSDQPDISHDGRYVCFTTLASNLVAGDTNSFRDIFVRDTCLGATGCTPSTTRVSVDTAGTQGNGASGFCSMSATGRYIAFESYATNLVAGDTNGMSDVFFRDTCAGAVGCTPSTVRVSLSAIGAVENSNSQFGEISGDGRYVVFLSNATNLVTGDTNNRADLFVRDTCLGAVACGATTTRVSVAGDGSQSNNSVTARHTVSADGRYVAWPSNASNLVANDTNNRADVFVRDTCAGAVGGCVPSTTRVSVDPAGGEVVGSSGITATAFSADGRYLAFDSAATNLVTGDTNGFIDMFVRDTCVGAGGGCVPTTTRASVTTAGAEANGISGSTPPAVASGGRFVAFDASTAFNLVPGDNNNNGDVFLRDTCLGAGGCTPSTSLVSVSTTAPNPGNSFSQQLSMSPSGRYVAFHSDAGNLIAGDTNLYQDIFRRDTCAGETVGCVPATLRVSIP